MTGATLRTFRRAETKTGKRMAALARSEGHRKALPPSMRPVAGPGSPTKPRDIRMLAALPATSIQIAADERMTQSDASNALCRLATRGYAVSDHKRPATYTLTTEGRRLVKARQIDRELKSVAGERVGEDVT